MGTINVSGYALSYVIARGVYLNNAISNDVLSINGVGLSFSVDNIFFRDNVLHSRSLYRSALRVGKRCVLDLAYAHFNHILNGTKDGNFLLNFQNRGGLVIHDRDNGVICYNDYATVHLIHNYYGVNKGTALIGWRNRKLGTKVHFP